MIDHPKESRWLVTGAAGFLGSHLIDELLQRGKVVLGLDSLDWGLADNIRRHLSDSSFSFAQIDIRDSRSLSVAMADYRPEYVVHLAALHYIPAAVADPVSTVSINVLGTQIVLKAALDAGATRIWFASTGDIYAPSETPHLETEVPKPFNVYGLTKLQGEQLIDLAANDYPERQFVIGRLFNLYGPGETNPHLLPEIMRQIAEAGDAPLRLGNLWPRRDMTPVHDAACAIIDMLSCSKPGVTTVNVGSGQAYSIAEVIGVVRIITGTALIVETDPGRVRKVERPHLQANVERLTQMIGWSPHSDIARGLTELVASMRLHHGPIVAKHA